MPTTFPVPVCLTAKGSIPPLAWRSKRLSISAFICAGSGTLVYHSFHNSPSCTASARSSWWASDSGSRVACVPRSVIGSGQGMQHLPLDHCRLGQLAGRRRVTGCNSPVGGIHPMGSPGILYPYVSKEEITGTINASHHGFLEKDETGDRHISKFAQL